MNNDGTTSVTNGTNNPSTNNRWSSWFSNPLFLSVWCTVAAFGAYGCMYAFRKPFTAGRYVSPPFNEGIKTWLVLAQVLGYTASKFIGIRVISEMKPARRGKVLIGLVGLALLALLLFALVPTPYKPVCLFLNGLPLGLVYGLVLGFLEGRRLTEAFVAGLCASFILADGFTKSIGANLLQRGVPEAWMPFASGLIFLMPLIGFVLMLQKIPPPSGADIVARSERTPMRWLDRRAFFIRHAPGLAGLLLMYLLVTVLRSLRADFAPELWAELGMPSTPALFTRSELWVAIGVLVLHASLVGVTHNRRAFFVGIGLSMIGMTTLTTALLLVSAGRVGPFPFMVLTGIGLYLPYVAAHTTLFERLMAMTRDRGNIGFLMYLADAVGYLGYAGVMVVHQFGHIQGDVVAWFVHIGWVVAAGSISGLVGTFLFYRRQK